MALSKRGVFIVILLCEHQKSHIEKYDKAAQKTETLSSFLKKG